MCDCAINRPAHGALSTGCSYAGRWLTFCWFVCHSQGYSDVWGTELYRSTGLRGGTQLVKDIAAGQGSSSPSFLLVCQGLLFFSADDGKHGQELWVSDGRLGAGPDDPELYQGTGGEGTFMVRDIRVGQGSSSPAFLTVAPDGLSVYFSADDGVHGQELWASDGTVAGTRLVKDIRGGAQGSGPSYLVSFNGRLYLQADDGLHGAELWVSDGTSAGTLLLNDLRPGSLGASPAYLTVLNSGGRQHLTFVADDGQGASTWGHKGSVLWVSDGSAQSTRRALPQTYSHVVVDDDSLHAAFPSRLVVYKHSLYFPASRGRLALHQPKQGLEPRTNDALVVGLEQALVITDVDQDPTAPMTLSLSSTKGRLWLAPEAAPLLGPLLHIATHNHSDQGVTTQTLVLNGTIFGLHVAMRHLMYSASPGAIGWEEIGVLVRDHVPACGLNASLQLCGNERLPNEVSAVLRLYISPVNHAPSLAVEALSVSGTVGEVVSLGQVLVSDEDVTQSRTMDVFGDTHEAALALTLSCSHGRLSLHWRDGLTFVQGDGLRDRETHVLAPLEALNAALQHVSYEAPVDGERVTPQLAASGFTDVVVLEVDDHGHTGKGGALTHRLEIAVTMAPAHTTEEKE